MKNLLLPFLVITIVFSSCKKDDFVTSNDDAPNALLHEGIDPDLADSEDPWTSGTAIPTNCVTVSGDGYLEVGSMSCFRDLMNAIVNRQRADIDAWETAINFTSRYTYYEGLESDTNYDDAANQDVRISDPYFESVLSPGDQIEINDTLYTYDFEDGELTAAYGTWDTTYILNGGSAMYKKASYCSTCKDWEGPKYYDNNTRRTEAYKWNFNYGIYGSWGIGIIHYKKRVNIWNNVVWKKSNASELNLFIDHWHSVDWYINGYPGLSGVMTNKKRHKSNARVNQWVGDFSINLWQPYCFEKFERFHCYRNDIMDDLHHEDYSCL